MIIALLEKYYLIVSNTYTQFAIMGVTLRYLCPDENSKNAVHIRSEAKA